MPQLSDMPSGNTSSVQANDVWSTINKGIDAVLAYKTATGKQSQTAATPTGSFSSSNLNWNPFPGAASPYPQADGKVIYGSAGGFPIGTIFLVTVLAIAAMLFLRRG